MTALAWRRPPWIRQRSHRWALAAGVGLYLLLALATLEIDTERLAEGLARGARFVAAFARPDFVSRSDDLLAGFRESLTMAITATAVGIVLSLPLAVGASRNLSPRWIYLPCRGVIAVSRSFNEVIVAILLVVLFGFGPFTGFLTLSFATVAFMAKLLAERVEDIEAGQLEALRATGAGFLQQLDFAVLSQIRPRLVGLSLYRLDINFRESAVIGVVGAGGIGTTLHTAMDRYEYRTAAAVIVVIVVVVAATELLSGWLRRRAL